MLLELVQQSHVHGVQEDWKPSFLSNGEFTQLMLEVRFIHFTCFNCVSASDIYKYTYVQRWASVKSVKHQINLAFSMRGSTFIYDDFKLKKNMVYIKKFSA